MRMCLIATAERIDRLGPSLRQQQPTEIYTKGVLSDSLDQGANHPAERFRSAFPSGFPRWTKK